MTRSDSGKKYAFIAAICCVITIVCSAVHKMIDMGCYTELGTGPIAHILVWLLWIGLAAALFGRHIPTVIGMTVCYTLIYSYEFIVYSGIWQLYILFTLAAAVSLIVLLSLTLAGKPAVSKIFFLPAAFMLIRNAIAVLGSTEGAPVYAGILAVFDPVKTVAFLFIGLWLRQRILSASAAASAEQ